MYPFFKRPLATQVLTDGFRRIVSSRSSTGIYLTGKRSVGKTRLVNEFFSWILDDKESLLDIPDLAKRPDQYIINYTCEESEKEEFGVFNEIRDRIIKERDVREIIYGVGSVILAALGINDLLNALNKLFGSVKRSTHAGGEGSSNLKEFVVFRKFIQRSCKKAPLVIYIQNSQWVDQSSLILINKLLTDQQSFWGMIILERDTDRSVDASDSFQMSIDRLIGLNLMENLYLEPLGNSFPREFCTLCFGDSMIESLENDLLYRQSEGLPGKLIKIIDFAKDKGWVYEQGGKWVKDENLFRDS